MADYFRPTVIQPTTPIADMTLLERLLLSHVFQSEPDGDGLYFYAETSANDLIQIPIGAVRAALAASDAIPSEANGLVRAELAALEGQDGGDLELDVSITGWAVLFQAIVRRSPSVAYVSAVTAFTCSKMRPDGFGGMAMVITAETVKAKSTDEMVETLLAESDYGAAGVGPGHGVHSLLRLTEENVRAAVINTIEVDRSIPITPGAVTDLDIRRACLAVVAATDLTEEQDKAVSDGAHLAIAAAVRRARPSAKLSRGGRHEQD